MNREFIGMCVVHRRSIREVEEVGFVLALRYRATCWEARFTRSAHAEGCGSKWEWIGFGKFDEEDGRASRYGMVVSGFRDAAWTRWDA
jgi:hypothetical protein